LGSVIRDGLDINTAWSRQVSLEEKWTLKKINAATFKKQNRIENITGIILLQ
jgi:hypothetical protein